MSRFIKFTIKTYGTCCSNRPSPSPSWRTPFEEYLSMAYLRYPLNRLIKLRISYQQESRGGLWMPQNLTRCQAAHMPYFNLSSKDLLIQIKTRQRCYNLNFSWLTWQGIKKLQTMNQEDSLKEWTLIKVYWL